MSKQKNLPASTDETLMAPPDVKAEQQVQQDLDAEALAALQHIERLPLAVRRHIAKKTGFRLPGGNLTAVIEGDYKWMLRCTKCNEPALYFVGTSFEDPNTGESYEKPPNHVRADQINWVQDLPPERQDRARPKCQVCHHPVEMNGDGTFRFDRKRLQELDDWKKTRDVSFSQKALRDLAARIGDTPQRAVNSEGRLVELMDVVPQAIRNELASEWLSKHNPDALRDIAATDEAFKHEGGLVGALAKAAKGR